MRKTIMLAAIVLAATPALAAAPAPITGRWLTPGGKAIVEIAPCGTSLCGRIAKILDPEAPKNARDTNNPDPAKRTRPIEGMDILTGFTADKADWRGQIYDPRSGKTYRSIIKRSGSGLEVKGCWGPFCQSQNWTAAK